MMRRFVVSLGLFLATLSAGCGPQEQYLLEPELEAGRPYDHANVAFLVEGATTRNEVLAWLGDPYVVHAEGPYEVWHYYIRRTRDRYGVNADDYQQGIVGAGHETIEEHSATLTFLGEVLHRVDERPVPHMADEPWVRATNPTPVPQEEEWGLGRDARD